MNGVASLQRAFSPTLRGGAVALAVIVGAAGAAVPRALDGDSAPGLAAAFLLGAAALCFASGFLVTMLAGVAVAGDYEHGVHLLHFAAGRSTRERLRAALASAALGTLELVAIAGASGAVAALGDDVAAGRPPTWGLAHAPTLTTLGRCAAIAAAAVVCGVALGAAARTRSAILLGVVGAFLCLGGLIYTSFSVLHDSSVLGWIPGAGLWPLTPLDVGPRLSLHLGLAARSANLVATSVLLVAVAARVARRRV